MDNATRPRVLIVDDEPMVIAAIEAVLQLDDIDTHSVADVDEAEAAMERGFFPVVLADLRLRGSRDGFHLLEAVQRMSPASRVATITGFADADTEARLLELGARAVLHKPLSADQIVAAVREMLATVEAAAGQDDLETLYHDTRARLQAIARGKFRFTPDDAEELLQETWLLFLEKRAEIREPHSWLRGAVANLCRQQIDRSVRSRARQTTIDETTQVVDARSDETLAVRQALQQLDDRSRALCRLIALEEHSYAEAAASTHIPLGSVGPLYIRAKAKLRNILSA